jgi:hypothetical protein
MVDIGNPFGTLSSDINCGFGVAFGGSEKRSKVIDVFDSNSWKNYSIFGISSDRGSMILDTYSAATNVPTIQDVPNTAPNVMLLGRPNSWEQVFFVSYPGDGLPSYPKVGDKFSVWIAESGSHIMNGDPEYGFWMLFGVGSATEDGIQDAYAVRFDSGTSLTDNELTLRKIRDGQPGKMGPAYWDTLGTQTGIEVPAEGGNEPEGWRRLVVDWKESVKEIEVQNINGDVLGSVTVSHTDPVLDSNRGVGFLCQKRSYLTSPRTVGFGPRGGLFQYAVINRLG